MSNPEQHKQKLTSIIKNYVPANAAELCADIIMHYKLHLHIEAERKSKYGDYTPHKGSAGKISVNHNLSKFEFLFTFIHELAHHTAFLKFGPHHESHGKEWKNEFRLCMQPFLNKDIFPYDLRAAVLKHMQNPKYSHSADIQLLRVLKRYDNKSMHKVLDNLPADAYFKIKNSEILMQKKHKLRTYYYCVNMQNNKPYKVHAMAEVTHVDMLPKM